MDVKDKGDTLVITDDGWRLIMKYEPETGYLYIGQGDAEQNIMSGAFIANFDDVADWIEERNRMKVQVLEEGHNVNPVQK